MELLTYILSGAGVGFIIGLTGVGGGALMTPLLLLFGYPAHIAIGTDLLYAATTKAGGMVSHARLGHVKWRIAGLLALGSIPAALVTGYLLMTFFTDSAQYKGLLSSSLGIMLILTAIVILFRKKLQNFALNRNPNEPKKSKSPALTVTMGVFLGVFVTLSSVGAGAIGTAVLMLLYPTLAASRVIGSDIAHAVPLTLVAGLIHLSMGHVDFQLLAALLIGSLPAIHFGSKLSSRLPNNIMHPILASMLFILGVKYSIF